MKAGFTYHDGKARVLLTPGDNVEELILRELAERSEKGCTTIFVAPARSEKEFVLEVAL